MKKYLFTFFAMVSFALFFLTGCGKKSIQYPVTVVDASTLNLPKPQVPPSVYAGNDQLVILPLDSVILEAYNGGDYSHTPKNGIRYDWNKIKGPETYAFENPHMLRPNITKLGQGAYEFELTATDSIGLYQKDTVLVVVMEPTNKEVIITNLGWTCDSEFCGSSTIKVPTQIPFTVLIGNKIADVWTDVLPVAQYAPLKKLIYYELHGNSMTIACESESNTGLFDLKIVF